MKIWMANTQHWVMCMYIYMFIETRQSKATMPEDMYMLAVIHTSGS